MWSSGVMHTSRDMWKPFPQDRRIHPAEAVTQIRMCPSPVPGHIIREILGME